MEVERSVGGRGAEDGPPAKVWPLRAATVCMGKVRIRSIKA